MADNPTNKTVKPELDTEVANRLVDPFEIDYLGIIRTNDPLLLEKGGGNSWQLYRDLKRDGKVFSGLQKRAMALVGFPWQITPVSESGGSDADKLTEIFKGFNFDKFCMDLLEALLAGFSVCEVVWSVSDEGFIVPKRLVRRAQRRFVYVQADPNEPPELHLLTRANMLAGESLPERKFIVHRVNPEDDNPYGTGLGLQLYWPVFFKRKGIIAWNKLNDRFGTPTPWGKYPKSAGVKEKRTLFDALKAMSSDGVVMTPEGTMIELLESKLTGSTTTQQSLCEYMDDWIAEVILGQDPRRKGGGGAVGAASKEREAVRLDLVQGDSDLLSETINSTLMAWICYYNGFEPCNLYRVIKPEDDLKAASETDKNVSEMGFELSVEAVTAKYGEGWSKKKDAPPPKPNAPSGTASFSEGSAAPIAPGQQAIDDALQSIPQADLQAAIADMLEPLLEAIEASSSYEEALAAAEAAFPKMDSAKLQGMLASAMFGAELFGRVGVD
ncbi:MAG: DUF935 family protein [Sulfuricellaceae bacterium]